MQACLDADRLNLWRAGKEPDLRFLFTRFARRPHVIKWAKGLAKSQVRYGDEPSEDHLLTWSQLVNIYRVSPAKLLQTLDAAAFDPASAGAS